jgi:hypothetical protein
MPGRPSAFIAAIAATLCAAVLVPASAPAATEIGNDCGAEHQAGDYVEVPEALASGGGLLPLAVPAEGVLTSWRIRSLSPTAAAARLGVFRLVDAGKFQLVAASGEEAAVFGPNTFKARIPVKAGDRFGTIPAAGEFFSCLTGNPDDHSWSHKGVVEVGGIYQFAAGVNTRVPIVGVVEPDVDGDGYGDETQDGCPRSAAAHVPCPPVATTFTVKAAKRAIAVEVKVSSVATVQVFGQVGWQVRGKPKTSARDHRLSVGLTAGAPREIAPGAPTRFRVPFSKPIKRRLGRITPKQALRALMTVRTTDLAGTVTEQRRRVKLKGQRGA